MASTSARIVSMSVRSSAYVSSVLQDFARWSGTTRRPSSPVREADEGIGPASDGAPQRVQGNVPHVHEAHAAEREKLLRRLRPDAPQRLDGQLLEETLDTLRRDHREAVGLLPAGGDFREKLVRRDAGRHGESRGFADVHFEAPGHVHAERLVPGVFGHVEVRLVEGERLDERRDGPVEVEDLPRDGGIAPEVGPHDREARAEAHRARHGHGRADAELPGLVARGGDDAAPFRVSAHGHGPAAQRGIVALLHGRVERVHVEVEDAARGKSQGSVASQSAGAARISGTVTMRTPAGGVSTAVTSAAVICSSVTRPRRRAPARVGGRSSRSA